jgi:putative MATE family efflux protein
VSEAAPPKARRAYDRSIVEGPIGRAVWRLAWPTIILNVVGGLQGIVDHAMVGHYVGFVGNAAIGVSWQIFLVIVVFLTSIFTGMGVLVARFAGANEPDKVNESVWQAFLVASALSFLVIAPVGWVASPWLLGLVNATAEVQAEALPYLRIMFVASFGMMLFFMLSGAFRAAGDARTPMVIGVVYTLLNLVLNVILIRGMGPIPGLGTTGAALGTVIAGALVSGYTIHLFLTGRAVIQFDRAMPKRPDPYIIRALFRFGLPAGIQGVAMNVGGVLLLRFVGSLELSAEAQAAYTVSYTQLFALVTWTSVGLMGAASTIAGQNLGAERPERSVAGVRVAAGIGLAGAAFVATLFLLAPNLLLAVFGMDDPAVVGLSVQLLRYLAVSSLFVTVALTYTGGLQGTGDTKSPLYISIVSQVVIPVGMCAVIQSLRPLQPGDIWLAIVLGHAARCTLSVGRFHQQKWRNIRVEIGGGRG